MTSGDDERNLILYILAVLIFIFLAATYELIEDKMQGWVAT
jgi:hypothetical protein